MAKKRQDIGYDDSYYDGDALEIEFDIKIPSGTDPLNGATVEWTVYDAGGGIVLSDGSSGVSTAIDESNGIVTVTVDSGVTDGSVGEYHHWLRVTDSDGDSVTVSTGRFKISKLVGA